MILLKSVTFVDNNLKRIGNSMHLCSKILCLSCTMLIGPSSFADQYPIEKRPEGIMGIATPRDCDGLNDWGIPIVMSDNLPIMYYNAVFSAIRTINKIVYDDPTVPATWKMFYATRKQNVVPMPETRLESDSFPSNNGIFSATLSDPWIRGLNNTALAANFYFVETKSNLISNAQIYFNSGKYQFGDGSTNKNVYDTESIALHEFGHSLCLAHSNDPSSVMYYAIAKGDVKRKFTSEDVKTICTIHGCL